MKLINKSELAKRAGVTRQTINRATIGRLADACIDGKVDLEHPLIVEYLATKTYQATASIGGIKTKNLAQLTIHEVVMKHGTLDGFKSLVESLKIIAAYKYRLLRIQQTRGELIRRDMVNRALIPLVDIAYQKLTVDLPPVLCQDIITCVKSGGADVVLSVEKMIRDAISHELKATKKTVIDRVPCND